ncbi:Bone morphogenetic protein 10, variant 2 [Homalodisca vitripennis]|nr:Bone morphogenetic protein 10, variant 2 [Homalodisca vitripennis]
MDDLLQLQCVCLLGREQFQPKLAKGGEGALVYFENREEASTGRISGSSGMYVDGSERGERRFPPIPGWCVLSAVLILAIPAILLALAGLSRRTSRDLEVTVYGHEMELPPPPPPRGALPPVPSVMMDLFRQGPHDQLPAEIVRSLTPRTIDGLQHRQPLGNSPGREHLHLLTFDVPSLTPGETLHSAQLRLTLSYLQFPAVENVTSVVRIYWDSTEASLTQEVHVPDHDHESEKKINFNCTDIIDKFYKLQSSQNAKGYVFHFVSPKIVPGDDFLGTGMDRGVIDVSGLNREWMSNAVDVSGLYRGVDCRPTLQLLVGVTLSRDLEASPQVGGTGENHDKLPLLLLLYSPLDVQNTSNPERTLPRHKRDLAAEEFEEETNRLWSGARSTPTRARSGRFRTFCRRRPLYVEFSDINYDTWIVAPNGYQSALRRTSVSVGACTP